MNNLKKVIIIPARLQSTRFPDKPLANINDIPMIIRVYQQALQTATDAIYVAGCDNKLKLLMDRYNFNYIETDLKLRSGTDRVYDCYKKLSLKYDLIVNLQCDIPFVNPESIAQVFTLLESNKQIDIATAATKINDLQQIQNRNDVKVILAQNNKALYFTRHPIKQPQNFKHLGIYGFRPASLQQFVSLNQSPLEKYEKLEQLRALENNMNIHAVIVNDPNISIDTPADLQNLKL